MGFVNPTLNRSLHLQCINRGGGGLSAAAQKQLQGVHLQAAAWNSAPHTLLPARRVVLGQGGYVSSGPHPVPPCGAALCGLDVVGWVGDWGAPLQRSPWWGGMCLVHNSEELLVRAASASLFDIVYSQSGDWLFVLQEKVSSSGTEQKFTDSTFSILQLLCQG